MSWILRFIRTLSSKRLDEDLAEEMRDHVSRRRAELEKEGLSPEEADRTARVRFGNETRFRERSRELRLWAVLDSTLQDIRYGWRSLLRQPPFALTAVTSLALAIGANAAIFAIIDAAILRPLPVEKPQELIRLSWPGISDAGTPGDEEREAFSYPVYLSFRDAAAPAARLALFGYPARMEAQVSSPEAPIEKIRAQFASGNAFDLLGVHPALGRLFTEADDRIGSPNAIAVLSYEYWHKRLHADPSVVGKVVWINGKTYRIEGVAGRGFFGIEPGKFIDVWIPATNYDPQALRDSGWHWARIVGRLSVGFSREQLHARLQPHFHDVQMERVKWIPTMPEAIRKEFLKSAIGVHPAATGVSDFRKSFARPLWIVFGVAAVILLIACSNIACLLLARSTVRAGEMAMRVSLGASRARLVRFLLTESLLISFLAGIAGSFMAKLLGPLVLHLASRNGESLQFALTINMPVLLFCIGISTLSAVLFGLLPAWKGSGVRPMISMRDTVRQEGKPALAKAFVSIQVGCAFCLVVVGAAFVFSLGNLLRVRPGFDARNVDVLNVYSGLAISGDPGIWMATHPAEEARIRNAMFQLRNEVLSRPGIQDVAIALWPIFEGTGWSQQVVIPGKGPSEREEIFYRVSPGYFTTMRTPLIAGRDFRPQEREVEGITPAIINEAFARRYFKGQEVLGRIFSRRTGTKHVIVGLASDARYYDLRKSVEPMVYLPMQPNGEFTLYIRSALDPGEVMRLVDREAQALAAGLRVREFTTLEAIVGNTLVREKLLASIGAAFAFFGLLLAGIGLFGVLNYSVARRTKEIGIRTAIGAKPRDILALIVQDIGGLLGLGVIAGCASALTILAILRSLLFGIRTVDPSVIAAATGLFLACALIAALLPAQRAARIDPVEALRTE